MPDMPGDLYERDILLWSEHQAELLRRVASGESVTGIDWRNIIEEVADVGGAALNNVRSLLRQAMVQLQKLHLLAVDPAAGHWSTEAGTFLMDAELWFSPSMRERIDLAELWRRARATMLRYVAASPAALPEQCPWTIDDLLAADVDALLSTLAKPTGTP